MEKVRFLLRLNSVTFKCNFKVIIIMFSGSLKHISNLKPWILYDVLIEKYDWDPKDAKVFASFLVPMLDLDQDNRASATQCLLHPWMLA